MRSFTLLACASVVRGLNITRYRDESLAPVPLPPSHADSDGEQIIEIFQNLGRTTVWKSIQNITMEGDTFEPEGMVRLGDDRYVFSIGEWTVRTQSYGEIINGTDRTAGEGFSHLVVYNGKGQKIADATITERNDIEYHNGGIDWDGKVIWGTNAQYRPNTTANIYTADPYTLEPTIRFRYRDHLGAIVHDTRDDLITAMNWGSRNATTWDLKKIKTCEGGGAYPRPESKVRNPSYFLDYQDCKWLGHSKLYDGRSVAFCSGVATIEGFNLGGVALVDVKTMTPLAETPIPIRTARGGRATQNPVDVSVHEGKLRLYFMPDQHNSTLYIYEAQPDSPFQFGGGPR